MPLSSISSAYYQSIGTQFPQVHSSSVEMANKNIEWRRIERPRCIVNCHDSHRAGKLCCKRTLEKGQAKGIRSLSRSKDRRVEVEELWLFLQYITRVMILQDHTKRDRDFTFHFAQDGLIQKKMSRSSFAEQRKTF